MTCFSPLSAARSVAPINDGKYKMRVFKKGKEPKYLNAGNRSFWQPLQLPCGQCKGCRYDRSKSWAIRCVHEAQLHKENCFLTLTYRPEDLPEDQSLNKRHFQLFMKKLRKHFSDKKIRFYHCGEYGSKLGRPHYHAIIFGLDFADKRLHKIDKQTGEKLYTSATLSKIWDYGFASIGTVTFNSAAYVARYIVDKINGDLAEFHYSGRLPEYSTMSLKPGIAAGWFEKFSTDVFPHDRVIIKGREMRPPKYYDTLYERIHADAYLKIKRKRIDNAREHADDNTPERLAVRRIVFDAKTSTLKRSLT
jgi:hypothetical protein